MAKEVKVQKGGNARVTVNIKDHNTGLPVPLVNFNGATGFFPLASGGSLNLSGELVSQDLGKVLFPLTIDEVESLNEGELQNLQVWADLGDAASTGTRLAGVFASLTVLGRAY